MKVSPSLSIAQCVSLACLWEASAPKVGNVNRGADFEDMSFYDLVSSASAISEILSEAANRSLGENVLHCVEATRRVVSCNTNLGIVLLLAPLAMVQRGESLQHGLIQMLEKLEPQDCLNVYRAIELAKPGGMGKVKTGDVGENGTPPEDLIKAMGLARKRDLIAAQYCNGFQEVFEFVAKSFLELQDVGCGIIDSIVETQLRLMRDYPDSLIARKCGNEIAEQSALMAGDVLNSERNSPEYHDKLSALDFWLRSDGHRRNPGTTADLITAGLFVVLREGLLKTPFKFE